MRTYKIGVQYEFIVNYFYTTIDDNGRKRCWLSLSDGEDECKYNVPAYPYQMTGFDGKTISCKVIRVLDNGYPYLIQNKADILKDGYNKGETYWFSVIEKIVDPKSNRPYFRLVDRSYNLEHRFYCSEDDTLEGVVGFNVKSIEQDHLVLEISQKSLSNPFGHEDATHEWKSSLVFPVGESNFDDPDVDSQIRIIMKSIAGFQNAEGGLLYIGVKDSGVIRGIESDYPFLSNGADSASYNQNTDGYECKIRTAVNHYLGKLSLDNIRLKFYYHNSSKHIFCVVIVNKTPRPVFLEYREVFKRFGNGYRQLKGDEITQLVVDKLNDSVPQSDFTMPMPNDCCELNPNQNVELTFATAQDSVVRLSNDVYKKKDFYYMTFYTNGDFLYSKNSHTSDENVFEEVRFNRYNGNIEYSRDILIKCTKDGHAQFLPAFEMCKLGAPDTRISILTDANKLGNLAVIRVVHKYDFVKVLFSDGTTDYEKYIRVQRLFGESTEKDLKSNNYNPRYEFGLKGNSMIPTKMTLQNVEVIHETLPDEILFVSANPGSSGKGHIVGSKYIDPAQY